MKLSDRSGRELKKLLAYLPTDEVLSLAQTVTNRQLVIHSRSDATEAIITFSQSIEELLKRQKLKKKAIFQYLASEHVSFDPNAEKRIMIDKVVEHMEKGLCNETVQYQASVPDDTNNAGVSNHANISASSDVKSSSDESFEFSKQFAGWFYKMLNDSNPSYLGENTKNELTPLHFYPDCKLKLLSNTSESRVDEYSGNDLVCERLVAFAQQEFLLFNPNLEVDGISSDRSAHGLHLIHVCGTIHRGQDVLGVFEQRFGLIKDLVMDNNWKIKFTNLCIQAGAPGGRPKLGGSMTQMLTNS